MASDHEFGILYRPEGVAERDIPSGHVGCVAHVERSELLPDGRSNILVTGGRRFALEQFEDTDLPYYVGRVVDVVDVAESAPTLTVLAARVRELFLRVGAAARSLADDADALPELPDDPAMLAFAIAAVIEMDVSTRQRLLASRSPTSRLREVEMLLAPAVDSLEHRAVIHVRAKTNGHGPQPQSPG
jgi:Lon protease-like protein